MPAFQIAPDRLPPEAGSDFWKVGGHSLAVFNVAGEGA